MAARVGGGEALVVSGQATSSSCLHDALSGPTLVDTGQFHVSWVLPASLQPAATHAHDPSHRQRPENIVHNDR